MQIAPLARRIGSLLKPLKPNLPVLKKTVREFAPYALGAAAAAVAAHQAYDFFPAFQQIVDSSREFLSQHQHIYEITTSGLTLGTVSDLIAQRYEILAGQSQSPKINWRRLAGMTVVGGLTGGVIVRQMFNFNVGMFPGNGFLPQLKRVLFDQFIFTPFYLPVVISVYSILTGSSIKRVPQKIKEILPVNWIVWGGCLSWIIYALPLDSMVYVQNILALMWRTFLIHKSFEDRKES